MKRTQFAMLQTIATRCPSVFLLCLIFLSTLAEHTVVGFQHPVLPSTTKHSISLAQSSNDSNDQENSDLNPLTKGVWYGVEKFGTLFGKRKEESAISVGPPTSLKENKQRIQTDFERSYFLSGDMDVEIYDDQCEFADPFVSFKGRDRFVDNLQNLGSFITKYDAKLLQYDSDTAASQVETKVMVKLELNLPWKPILAWPWGVTFEIDPATYKVVRHIESWDIEPVEGVKQIFRKATVKL